LQNTNKFALLKEKGKMKKILTVITISLLCFSMFSMLVPKVNATTEQFPLLWTRNTSATVQGMAVGDINGDGKNEVVYAEWTGMVYAVDSSGNVLWTFRTGWYDNIAIGDLRGDGKKEVVIASADCHVYCLDGKTGNLLLSYATAELACHGPLTLTDINGDGKKEIVVGEWDSNVYVESPANVYVLDCAGNLLWKHAVHDDVIPFAADVNNSGREEVFAYWGRYMPPTRSTGFMCRFNSDGTVDWNMSIPGCAWMVPIFLDVNGDGNKEIITCRTSDDAILILNSTDGSLLQVIPNSYGALWWAGDLHNDGYIEFLTNSGNTLYALNFSGNEIWSSQLSSGALALKVADLSNSCQKEIVVGTTGFVYVLSSQGSIIWSASMKDDVATIEIADIDGDGLLDIVVGTRNESDQTLPEIVSVFKNSARALVGYWDFDEGSGTVAHDKSGNGNEGTLHGGAVWVNGRHGEALSFNGVDSYVRVEDSPSLHIFSAVTVEAWVYLRTGVHYPDHTVILSKDASNGGTNLDLQIYNDTGEIAFGVGYDGGVWPEQADFVFSVETVPRAVWTHVAGTYNGSFLKVFFNGVLDSAKPFTGGINTDNGMPLCIGTKSRVGEFLLNGIVDDVRIYNRALSQQEIQADMETIFEDNFESYSVGAFPPTWSGWQIVWNGAGDQYQVVTDSYCHSLNKSLQLVGSYGWSIVVKKDFSSSSNIIGYEGYLMSADYGSNPQMGTASIGFFNEPIAQWGRYYANVGFGSDGFIETSNNGSLVKLQAYTPLTWYKIRTVLDKSSRTYNVWINDVLVGANLVEANSPNEILSLQLSEGWQSTYCYFDDVKVFELGPSSNPTANFTWSPPMPRATKTVTFNASSSTPNTGTIVSYTWNFGDANITTTTNSLITHRYAVSKRYNVTLTVLNSVGLTGSVTKTVKITCLADINMVGKVDIKDLAMVTAAFGSYPGLPRWNPDCDMNGDNKIDIFDVAYVCHYFGWHDP
jgi:hypothetical protein